MEKRYSEWIGIHYPTRESARLQCAEATSAMVAAFPELRRVRGHVVMGLDFVPHWWCESGGGVVVDPTVHQWSATPVMYDEHEGEDPHGKCVNCGAWLYMSVDGASYRCQSCQPQEAQTIRIGPAE